MIRFKNYASAEKALQLAILTQPDFETKTTFEKINTGFILTDITDVKNDHSNYTYATEFAQWILSGQKQISEELVKINPWIKRFVDNTNLPANFSSSYGWKLMEQLHLIVDELTENPESRRGYVNILYPADEIIRRSKTTMEYPCTIGMHFFVRNNQLHCITNMRSNNVYSVLPYDVFNFTYIQRHLARRLEIDYGEYHHHINNAHIFKGDARRLSNKQ